MTTRYEFGIGYGEDYRRRMRGREQMRRQAEQDLRKLPEEDQARLRYESDYYGFRGAGTRGGSRGGYAAEYRSRPRTRRRR